MVGEGDIPSIEGLLGLEAIIGVEEDGLNIAFNLGLYQPPGKEDSFEVAVIGLQGRRILAALPGTAWHRKLDRRVLPPGTITRPLFVRVAGCGEEDRFEILAGCLVDVWIGWLGEDVWSKPVFDPSQTGTHRFVDTNSGAACFPFAEALSKVVKEKFNFVTPVHDVGDERLAALESRFSSLEGSIQQLLALQQGGGGSGYATAAEHLSSGSAAPGVTRPRLGARPKAEVSAPPPGLDDHMELAGLDPATVASALQAGIPRSQLLVMGKLLREKPKIGEVPQARRLATFDQDELSETDDIFPAQALEETKEAAQDPVSEALVKLTSILGKLSNRGGDDLLDGGGSGSADTSLQQSRRHTAVLTALKKALSKEPQKIWKAIEQNMAEQFNLSTSLPNTSGHAFTARAWAEHRSKILNYPRSVRFTWAVAGALDALRENKPDEARARLGLCLAQMEQEALDHGSALLSQEFSFEPPPPFSSFQTHQLPEATEMPYTKLLPPTWVAACAHKLKEVDTYIDMRKKLGQRGKPSVPASPVPKAPPKAGGKGGGKRKGGEQEGGEGA